MSLSNYPAINPTLLMDFANSAKLDSRFQPNRASTATVMGSGGYIISVGTQLPRFRYNAFTGACEGYLVEGQRTNLCTYSDDLSNANFRKNNGTVTANATTAPDGSSGGDFFQGTGSSGMSMDTYPNDYGGSGNETQTFSFFVKANGVNTIASTIGGGTIATFNLSTATVSGNGTIEAYPNGWYRVSATTVKSNVYWYWGATLNGGSSVPVGSGVYMWGFQIENSPFATSYIPTAASTVTRAADIPYIDSGENLTTIGGTLLFEGSPREDGNSGLYTFLTGFFSGSTERFVFSASSTGANLNVSYSTTSITLGSLPSTNTPIKLIGAFDASGLAACRDGGAVSTSGALTLGGANRYFIGNTFFGSGTYTAVNGVIKKIAYWPSKLTNAQLQKLTS